MNKHDDAPNSRRWFIALPAAVVVLLGILWSGFWYWSTMRAEATMAAWRGREAAAGRIYGCAATESGGYPFRIEVNCAQPSVDDRDTALSIRASNLSAVAQVFDPTLVIGEIAGPLTVAPLGGAPAATMDWSLAQASLRGTPGAPERLSVAVDNPVLAAAPSGGTLAMAEHMEIHGRFAAESTPGHPVLDLALDLRNAKAPAVVSALGRLAPLAAAGADFTAVAALHGVSDHLTLKSLAQQLRDIQAADGRLQVTNARLKQGDLIVVATGVLSLSARGALTGDLRLTVVNVARLIPLLGLERVAVSQETINRVAPALDRLLPGLGSALRGRDSAPTGSAPSDSAQSGAAAAASAAAGAALLGGQPAELEGQQAVTLTLRFEDGVAYIGPLKIGEVPPLY
ncbi:MAG: DUF2125 domain-containing protein [Bradyrhizobiaceae bacterium]|nr:DUF2125 domain-containing protein [Bradyrhizobiaceae bacterium]